MSEIGSRIAAASQFLLQSPPGEINDCFNDLRTIVSSDAALETGIIPALRKYNLEQFLVCSLEGQNTIISEVGSVEGEEDIFLDPRRGITFKFDHMRVEASDPQPIATDPETNKIRGELDEALSKYVGNHYSDGVCAVYSVRDENYPTSTPVVVVVEEEKKEDLVEPETAVEDVAEEEEKDAGEVGEKEEMVVDPKIEETPEEVIEPTDIAPAVAEIPKTPAVESRIFSLHFVGNKYNPGNYWTGRWRAVYVVDYAKGTLEGSVKLNTHYYEQGNVQLSTTLTSSHPLPSSSSSPLPTASAIINLLKQTEQTLQSQLSLTSSTFAEETFRNLRRALPKTRSKLDWGKIGGYRLGNELGGSIPASS